MIVGINLKSNHNKTYGNYQAFITMLNLEELEQYSQWISDRLTEKREMDFRVENFMDLVKENVNLLFSNADSKKLDKLEDSLRKKVNKQPVQKNELAKQAFELASNCINRLDNDLHIVKVELERYQNELVNDYNLYNISSDESDEVY